jgi:hypothetical protein
MKMIEKFLWIGFVFLNIVGYSQEHDLKKLMPAEGSIEGWIIKDPIEIFIGDDLFEMINGGADIYLEYGFVQVAQMKFENAVAVRDHLEIYEMEDSNAAYGIFTMNSSGKGNIIEIGDVAILYDYYLHFVKGKYYVRCTTSRKEESNIQSIKDFAVIIEKNIKEKGEKPELLKSFDLQGKEINKVKYFEGQIALGNIYNFGHGSVAGFIKGVACNWEDKQLFVLAYENDKKRREWFASLKGKMNMNKKYSDYTTVEDGITVKDKNGKFLSFKPYGKYYMIVKGLNWNEAAPVFEEIIGNLP